MTKWIKIFVLFDQTEVEYHRTDWQQLTLAYCCSIHKAQGSEFQDGHFTNGESVLTNVAKKSIVYTAVTKVSSISHVWGSRERSKRVNYHPSKTSNFLTRVLNEFRH